MLMMDSMASENNATELDRRNADTFRRKTTIPTKMAKAAIRFFSMIVQRINALTHFSVSQHLKCVPLGPRGRVR